MTWKEIIMYRIIEGYIDRISAYGWGTVVIELLVIGLIIFVILNFLQGTRGLRLLRGLILILVTGFLVLKVFAGRMGMDRLNVLAGPMLYGIFFGSLVVFQPELRRALMRIGEARWLRSLIHESETSIGAIVGAVRYCSHHKIGVLLAIERHVSLGTVVESGVRLDAVLTSELIKTIFWPGSALHDLGAVIQEGRLAAAGCQFPLTESDELDSSLGSRHRAAVGLSEDCDAIIIIVSEETGIISIAHNGKLYRDFTPESLEHELRRLMELEKHDSHAAETGVQA
jgi:diadenylate cyclase